ncbi:MAG: FmdB family zinc ribbon protein [Rhodothermales bacterium]
MPTYTYKREDGTIFEIDQRITEAPLTTCPETGQPVKRIIRGAGGLVFKGSGFYLTDYARSGNAGGKKSASSSTTGASDASSSSTENKPASSASSPASSD